MTASSLIEDCEQITKQHTAIAQPAKESLLAALRTCHEVNRARNRAIHDAWVTRPGEMTVTLRGGRRARDVTVTAGMLAGARQLAGEVAGAAAGLKAAMTTALGPGWVLVEDQLRQETGRDIGAEPR